MKNKIKEIHNKLSYSKIDSFDSIISVSSFSSVLKDRFISELNKLDIDWDLEPTSINKLIKFNSKSSKQKTINITKEVNHLSQNSENLLNSQIGIDIQFVNDIPVVKDPWEDDFYKDNFNKNEIAHCLKKIKPFESFAGIFAVKEAIYKIDGIKKKDIKITFNNKGKPSSDLYSISISHDNGYAIAVALKNKKNYNNQLKELKSDILNINNKIKNQDSKNSANNKQFIKKTINKSNRLVGLTLLLIIIYTIIKDFII